MPTFITEDGAELFYRTAGNGGRTALFVHPFMHDGTIWMDQLRSLCDVRRCVAIDMRGHGRSDPSTSPAMIEQEYVDDLVAFMATLPPGRIDLVGLAIGGTLCALLADQHPDRIASLTLISSSFSGTADAAGKRYSWEYGRLAVMQGKDVVFRRAMDYIFGPDASLFAKARFRGIIDRTPFETYVAFYCNAQLEPRADLPARLTLPVFVPHGEKDPTIDLTGPLGQFPNLRTRELKGAGRLLPIESPDVFNAALREFWESLPA